MLSKGQLEKKLNNSQLINERLATLRLAEEINPKFRDPHIIGGYLRNIALDCTPKDCDVVFKGYQLNQPDVLEAVREAEIKLNIAPVEWDFENALATGLSDDFYKNTIGMYSHHTDYLTLLLIDKNGSLQIGDKKTLSDLDERVYDLRFSGVEVWANHRAKEKSYTYCLTGDLIRGLYLGSFLSLSYSEIASFLLYHFDSFYNELSEKDQKSRQSFWLKKTKGEVSYQTMLDKFGVTTLKVT